MLTLVSKIFLKNLHESMCLCAEDLETLTILSCRTFVRETKDNEMLLNKLTMPMLCYQQYWYLCAFLSPFWFFESFSVLLHDHRIIHNRILLTIWTLTQYGIDFIAESRVNRAKREGQWRIVRDNCSWWIAIYFQFCKM